MHVIGTVLGVVKGELLLRLPELRLKPSTLSTGDEPLYAHQRRSHQTLEGISPDGRLEEKALFSSSVERGCSRPQRTQRSEARCQPRWTI